MSLTLVVAALWAWVQGNVWPLVAGFVVRHLSPSLVASVEAVWNKVDAEFKALVAWVKSKV